jgi:HlyD family secretion protein
LLAAARTAGRSKRREMRVWILKDGQPVGVPVTVGLEDGTWAEIAGGAISPGTPVITDEIAAGSAPAKRSTRTPFRF